MQPHDWFYLGLTVGGFLLSLGGLVYVLAWLGLIPAPDIKFEIDHSDADRLDPRDIAETYRKGGLL